MEAGDEDCEKGRFQAFPKTASATSTSLCLSIAFPVGCQNFLRAHLAHYQQREQPAVRSSQTNPSSSGLVYDSLTAPKAVWSNLDGLSMSMSINALTEQALILTWMTCIAV